MSMLNWQTTLSVGNAAAALMLDLDLYVTSSNFPINKYGVNSRRHNQVHTHTVCFKALLLLKHL